MALLEKRRGHNSGDGESPLEVNVFEPCLVIFAPVLGILLLSEAGS